MQRRIHRGWLAALIALWAVGATGAEVVEPSSNVTQEQAQQLVDQIVPRVEELRGLLFKKPVPVEVVDDATLREHMLTQLHEFDQEEQIERVHRVYELLGLLPSGFDLMEELLGTMEEQAGGYYDPFTGAYYLLDDFPAAVAPIFTAHELTHALEDQHYDMKKRLRDVIENDDRVLAERSVIEGSATLLMSVYTMGAVMRGEMEAAALMEVAQTEAGKAERLTALPEVLQRDLLGPYLLGSLFLARGNMMSLAGGFPVERVNEVMAATPSSTEQILHPEKYWDEKQRDEPATLELGSAGKGLGKGWKRLGEGVLGELTLGVLVGAATPFTPGAPTLSDASSWTNAAAAGWDGDRWELWARGDETAVLLLTEWDTPADAKEFAEALPADRGLASKTARRRVAVVAGDTGDKTDKLLTRMLR